MISRRRVLRWTDMVRTIVVVASLAIAAAACGGKSPPPQTASEEKKAEPATAEPAVPAKTDNGFVEVAFVRMREYKAAVCACQDKACVDGAQKGLMDWAMEHMEELKDVQPTDAQNAEADKIQEEIDVCEARFGGGASEMPAEAEIPPQKAATVAEIIASMRSFKDQVCKCKDKACVDKVQKEMIDWAMERMDAMKDIKPTKAQEQEADKIEAEMDACQAKIK